MSMDGLKVLWLATFLFLFIKLVGSLASVVSLFICAKEVNTNRLFSETYLQIAYSYVVYSAACANILISLVVMLGFLGNAVVNKLDYLLEGAGLTLSLTCILEMLGGLMAILMYLYVFVDSTKDPTRVTIVIDYASLAKLYRCCGANGPKAYGDRIPSFCCRNGNNCTVTTAYNLSCTEVLNEGTICLRDLGIVMMVFAGVSFVASIVIGVFVSLRDQSD